MTTRTGSRRRRWLRRLLIGLGVLGLAVAIDLRTFVLPDPGKPRAVDLVLVLGPIYNDTRLQLAQDVVARFPGAVLLVSVDDPVHNCQGLRAPGARATMCFRPDPFTTRGEAEQAGQVARDRHLRSVLVIAPPDQISRAKLVVGRCVPGPVHGLVVPRPRRETLHLLKYQNAAMAQAMVRFRC